MLSQGFAYSQPLGVVGRGRGEESVERVVARDDEAGNVGEELATNVEDDEEEVEGGKAKSSVGLGEASLLLKVVENGVLGKLWRGKLGVSDDDAQIEEECDRAARPERGRRGDAYLLVENPEVVLRLFLGRRHDCCCCCELTTKSGLSCMLFVGGAKG